MHGLGNREYSVHFLNDFSYCAVAKLVKHMVLGSVNAVAGLKPFARGGTNPNFFLAQKFQVPFVITNHPTIFIFTKNTV